MKAIELSVLLCVFATSLSTPINNLSACTSITLEDSVSMATCCHHALPFTNETLAKCNEKIVSGSLSKEFECLPDCLYTLDKILGPDGKFDKSAWIKLSEENVPEHWKPVIKNFIEKCENFKTALDATPAHQCPTSRSDVPFGCLMIQEYLNCPDPAWNKGELCDAPREKFRSCFGPLFQKR